MTAVAPPVDACAACLRRAELVGALSGRIEQEWRLRTGRPQLLALPDAALLDWGRDAAARAAYDTFDMEAAVQRCVRARLTATCRCAAAYPPGLRDLLDPPAVLFARRTASDDEGLGEHGPPVVALVGARRASAAGLEFARSLGRGLGAAGVTVVSGLALGIDAAAHEGALDAGGRTVAVLATGADRPYPARHGGLHGRIAASGGVVAELPPGSAPRRWAFPARNRVIAALASVTVVVEGGDRSGSLITADFAADLGRTVAAVPGPVTAPLSAGPHLLLKAGAALVQGPEDVLELLAEMPAPGMGGRLPGGAVLEAAHAAAASTPPVVPVPADLGAQERATLERVEAGADTLAALTTGTDDALAVLADLGVLEVRGLVRRLPDGRYLRALR